MVKETQDDDRLLYVTYDERLKIDMHFESGDVTFTIPKENGIDEICYGSARVFGRRAAAWGEDTPGVSGIQMNGRDEDLWQIKRSLDALLIAPLINSLRLRAPVIRALTGLRSAVANRLDDHCWAVVLPDGRPLTAHWLRHEADADDSLEDAAHDRYGLRCDESTIFRTIQTRWSELPDDIRP